MPWLWLLSLVPLGVLWSVPVLASDLLRVDVYYSRDVAVQQSVVEALSQALREQRSDTIEYRLVARDPERPFEIEATDPDLRVSVGSVTARGLAEADGGVPRLYAFLPKLTWLDIESCCAPVEGYDSALWIDRPIDQQLRLIKSLLPSLQRLGILLGPTSGPLESEVAAAAEAQGVIPVFRSVGDSDGVGPALRDMVRDVDALLAVPDPVVFNRDTLYAILLTTYSANRPLVGYSEGLVKAGAAAALYLSPEDAGRDLARAIERFARKGRLEPPGVSPSSSLAVNPKVLRSLGIETDALDDLQRAFGEGGGQ